MRATSLSSLALIVASLLFAPRARSAEVVLFEELFSSGLGQLGPFTCGAGGSWMYADGDDCPGSAAAPSWPGHARFAAGPSCDLYSDGEVLSTLTSLPIAVSDCVGRVVLEYWYLLDFDSRDGPEFDRARVQACTGDGCIDLADNGSRIFVQVPVCGASVNSGVGGLIADNTWHHNVHDVSELLGEERLWPRFAIETTDDFFNDGQGLLLDDVRLRCELRETDRYLLRATFDDGQAGQPPGQPEVGSSFSEVGLVLEHHPVADLRVRFDDGSYLGLIPDGQEEVFTVEFNVEVVSGGQGGNFAVIASVFLVPEGRLTLVWYNDSFFYLEVRRDHLSADYFSLDVGWAAERADHVRFALDTVNDLFSLWIGSDLLLANYPLGADISGLSWLSFGGQGSFRLDDVLVYRSAPTLLFTDGFESGDTSRWSAATP